jgi:ribose transport system substrate-binding protein
MKNRIRLHALAAVAAIGLASPLLAQAQNKVNLGVAIPAATHSFAAGLVYWANEAKKELEKDPNIKVTIKTASGAPEQANQLQDLVSATKIDSLVILPFESAALTRPVQQVKGRGVYVTVVDRGLTDTSAQDAYVSGDNTAFGKVPAEYLAKALNGKGNIVALRGIPTTIDNERMDAFKEIDAVWAADDDMAFGVLRAIEQAKRTDIKIVFGGAGAKAMVKTLMDGSNPLIQANVSYSPKFLYEAIKMTALARQKGEKLPATTIVPSVLITKDNAKDFYFPDSPF